MKKKIVSLCLCVALLAVAVIGGTLAYFTDTDAAENTFTMGKVEIKLDEAEVEFDEDTHEYVGKDNRVQKNNYEHLYPGQLLPKDPTVYNTGDYDAYMRVKVAFPVISSEAQADFTAVAGLFSECVESDYVFPTSITADTISKVLVGFDATKWDVEQTEYNMPFFGTTDNILVLTFTYKDVLAPEDEVVLFTDVQLPAGIENSINFNMNITAEAVQADGFDSAAAAFAATFDAE